MTAQIKLVKTKKHIGLQLTKSAPT